MRYIIILVLLFGLTACGGFGNPNKPKLDPGGSDDPGGGTCGGNANLSWTAPTKNSDGSVLDDLAGFIIFRGFSSNNYTEMINIFDKNAVSYLFNNIQSDTKHFFAAKAFDTSANESGFSNEAIKTTSPCPPAKDEPEEIIDEEINPEVLAASFEFQNLFFNLDNKYELLEDAYGDSDKMPDLDVFHEFGDPNSRICIEVLKSDKSSTKSVMVHRFLKREVGGGPLLPPVEIRKIIVNEKPNIFYHFDKTTMDKSWGDLITRTEFSEENYRETKLRKNGEMIHFKSTIKNHNGTDQSFGYCYYPPDEDSAEGDSSIEEGEEI